MAKPKLSAGQKRLETDLWIILLCTLAALGAYMVLQDWVTAFMEDKSTTILLRVVVPAMFQFGIAGLGISVVSIIRKESFLSFGLRKKGTLASVVLCILCVVPYAIFKVETGAADRYLPFQSVFTTKEVLASGFPTNLVGMILTALAWGFFEGFNYVVISDKINKRYPGKNKWLNWGAIVCAVLCILIHGAIGVTVEGTIEMLTVMIIIYGMLVAKEFTGNAWGCVFLFIFLWNAF